ncbi:MAG: ADP-ribosylation factor-like protein [Promethearchaeota archaeon]
MKEELNNTSAKKKILIMGLDQAGKTCIVQSLQGIKNLTAFTSSKPTKVYNTISFHALGSEYVILDFGGQEAYRDDHLEKFDSYIRDTNKFIYVIDVQDEKRYKLAVSYLKKIINSLPVDNENVIEFSVFLHKFDPDLEQLSKNINKQTLKELLEKIKGLFPPNLSYSIHKTSIYTVFEKTSLL